MSRLSVDHGEIIAVDYFPVQINRYLCIHHGRTVIEAVRYVIRLFTSLIIGYIYGFHVFANGND